MKLDFLFKTYDMCHNVDPKLVTINIVSYLEWQYFENRLSVRTKDS
jgi:hypothetical protein